MSILRPSKEAILDDLRSFVLNAAEERTGFLATAVSKLNVVCLLYTSDAADE